MFTGQLPCVPRQGQAGSFEIHPETIRHHFAAS